MHARGWSALPSGLPAILLGGLLAGTLDIDLTKEPLGTGSDGNRVTPRTSAFRESTGPVLGAVGWRLACAIAHEQAAPASMRDDSFAADGAT